MSDPGRESPSRDKRRDCPRCRRTRWVLTLLMLAIMAYILYMDQFAH